MITFRKVWLKLIIKPIGLSLTGIARKRKKLQKCKAILQLMLINKKYCKASHNNNNNNNNNVFVKRPIEAIHK